MLPREKECQLRRPVTLHIINLIGMLYIFHRTETKTSELAKRKQERKRSTELWTAYVMSVTFKSAIYFLHVYSSRDKKERNQ